MVRFGDYWSCTAGATVTVIADESPQTPDEILSGDSDEALSDYTGLDFGDGGVDDYSPVLDEEYTDAEDLLGEGGDDGAHPFKRTRAHLFQECHPPGSGMPTPCNQIHVPLRAKTHPIKDHANAKGNEPQRSLTLEIPAFSCLFVLLPAVGAHAGSGGSASVGLCVTRWQGRTPVFSDDC